MHYFLFFASILSLSQSANLARLAAAPVEIIGFWRLVIAILIMAPFALHSIREEFSQLKKAPLAYGIASGLFFFTHIWTYTYAAMNTKIANCVILFAINPLFTALGSRVWFKDKFSKRLVITYTLAVMGIFLLFYEGISLDQDYFWGNVSAVLSAVLYSGYVLTGSFVRKKVSNLVYTNLVYVCAAGCFAVLAMARGTPMVDYPLITWISIGGLVVFSTLIGHSLFSYLLRYLNVNWMSCGKLVEPALSSITAFLLFGEQLSRAALLAYGLSVASVLILIAPWSPLPSPLRPSPATELVRPSPATDLSGD